MSAAPSVGVRAHWIVVIFWLSPSHDEIALFAQLPSTLNRKWRLTRYPYEVMLVYHDRATDHIPELVGFVISRRRNLRALVKQDSLTTARRTFPNVDAKGIFPIAGKEMVSRICGIGEAMRDRDAKESATSDAQDVTLLDLVILSLCGSRRHIYCQSLGCHHSESPSICFDTFVHRVALRTFCTYIVTVSRAMCIYDVIGRHDLPHSVLQPQLQTMRHDEHGGIVHPVLKP